MVPARNASGNMGDIPEAFGAGFLQQNCTATIRANSNISPVQARLVGCPVPNLGMRNLIIVAFIEPVAEGQEFLRSDWPLHITLVRFDVTNDGDAARYAALAETPAKQALGTVLAVGGEDRFGRQGSVPVSLVEADPALQALHDSLVQAVEQVSGRVASPHHTRQNFRPHVSHRGDKRLNRGDAVVLDQIALVDMAPDGNHTIRRVLELWALRK
jgi:hypothetical protein